MKTISRLASSNSASLLVMSLAPLPAAYAATACATAQSSGHCYAEMEDDDTPATARWGGYVRMDSDDLCFDDDDYAFANEEMWGFTSGSTHGGGWWVEVGLKAYRQNASDIYRATIFWADNKPSAGYTEHWISSPLPILDGDMGVHVEESGTSDWAVYARGTHIGTNTNNGNTSFGAQGGLEVRYRNSRVHGHFDQSQHEKEGTTNVVSGWYSPFEWDTGGAAGATWLSSAHDGVHTVYNYSGTTCPSGAKLSIPQRGRVASPSDDQQDPVKIALAFAATNGDSDPVITSVQSTTRSEALATLGGDEVPDDSPVVMVVMTGAFTGDAASVPAGAELPKGDTLSVVIDPSGEISDWNLNDGQPAAESAR